MLSHLQPVLFRNHRDKIHAWHHACLNECLHHAQGLRVRLGVLAAKQNAVVDAIYPHFVFLFVYVP